MMTLEELERMMVCAPFLQDPEVDIEQRLAPVFTLAASQLKLDEMVAARVACLGALHWQTGEALGRELTDIDAAHAEWKEGRG